MKRDSLKTLLEIEKELDKKIESLSEVGIEWDNLGRICDKLATFILDEVGIPDDNTDDCHDNPNYYCREYWDDMFIYYLNDEVTTDQFIVDLETEVKCLDIKKKTYYAKKLHEMGIKTYGMTSIKNMSGEQVKKIYENYLNLQNHICTGELPY